MSEATRIPKEKLIADLHAVVADAEALLKATAGQAGSDVAELRGKVQARLAQAKESLIDAQHVVFDKAKAAGQAADTYVHENPWQSIGLAAGIGLLVGLLVARR